MVYRAIEALFSLLNSDAWNLLSVFCPIFILGVVRFNSADSVGTSESIAIKERLESAWRLFSSLVNQRVEKIRTNSSDSQEEAALLSSVEKEKKENDKSKGKRPVRAVEPLINPFEWRDDFWNFDGFQKNDLFSNENENESTWEDSLNEEEEEDDSSVEENENAAEEIDEHKRANYAGEFFRKRNYPADVQDEDAQASALEPNSSGRWRWKSEDLVSADVAEVPKSEQTELCADDSDKSDESDETASEEEKESVWEEYIDEDFINDDSKPYKERIEYLRGRLNDGVEEAREDLTRLIVLYAATAGVDEKKDVLAALNEAESLVKSDPFFDDDLSDDADFERGEDDGDLVAFGNDSRLLLAQVKLQRITYLWRHNLDCPTDYIDRTLNFIRDWAESSSLSEERRLLATAWRLRGAIMNRSGYTSSSLSSYFQALAILESLVDEGDDEIVPLLGFLCATIGDVYRQSGEAERAIEFYRRALKYVDAYSNQEEFLAEAVNIYYRLSLVFQKSGKNSDVDLMMQKAIESEERLFAYDEDGYCFSFVHLLGLQSDLLASRGEFETALAYIDRAVGILRSSFETEAPLQKRLAAYGFLTLMLRRRLNVYAHLERYEALAQDLEESFETLTQNCKKNEDYDPDAQIALTSFFLYNACVCQGLNSLARRTKEVFDNFVSYVDSAEQNKLVYLTSALLTQRYSIFGRSGNFKEAKVATQQAISLIERYLQTAAVQKNKGDEDVEENEEEVAAAERNSEFMRVVLARALMQQGAILISEERYERAKDVLRRSKSLCLQYALKVEDSELNESDLFLNAIICLVSAELKTHSYQEARADLVLGISFAVKQLRSGVWDVLEEFANLTRLSIDWAQETNDIGAGLRHIALGLRFVERARLAFIARGLEFDSEGKETKGCRKIAEMFARVQIGFHNRRVDLLTDAKWENGWERYCEPKTVLQSTQGATPEDESSVEWSDVLINMSKRERVASVPKYREQFLKVELKDNPSLRVIFEDLIFCIDKLEQIVVINESFDRETMNAYSHCFDHLLSVYDGVGKSVMLFMEAERVGFILDKIIRRYSKKQETAEGINDVPQEFAFASTTLWEMVAAITSRLALEVYGASAEQDESKENESEDSKDSADEESDNSKDSRVLGEREKAVLEALFELLSKTSEDAYAKTVLAHKRAILQDPSLQFHLNDIIVSRGAFLIGIGCKEEAVQYVRSEGNALEERVDRSSATDLLTLGCYWDSVANVLSERVESDEFTEECLHNSASAMRQEKKALGVRFQELESTGNFVFYERMGNLHRRRAALAAEKREARKARRETRLAALYYSRSVLKGSFQPVVLRVFTEVLVELFDSSDQKDRRLATKLFDALERRVNVWSRKARAEAADSLWVATTAAAIFYSSKRCSFYRASRLYEAAEEMRRLIPNMVPPLKFRLTEVKIREAHFWALWGRFERAASSLEIAVDERKQQLETLTKIVDEQKNNFLLQRMGLDFGRQLAELGGFQTFLEFSSKDWDGVKATVEQLLPLLDSSPDVQMRLPARVLRRQLWLQKGSVFCRVLLKKLKLDRWIKLKPYEAQLPYKDFTFGIDLSATRVQVLSYSAIADFESAVSTTSEKSIENSIEEARKYFGARSVIGKLCWYHWAETMLRAKRYDRVLKAGARASSVPSIESMRNYMTPNAFPDGSLYALDLYKIMAIARIERGRKRDLVLASNDVTKGLEKAFNLWRQNRFYVRPLIAELFFLRARIAYKRGQTLDALHNAERAAHIYAVAKRRGYEGLPTSVCEEIEPYIMMLREELELK